MYWDVAPPVRIPYLDLGRAVTAQGAVTLPGSKSMSNRVLLLAALAEGTTHITGLLDLCLNNILQ
jgi:3-phosphoshikimate 1-carboxyvinyltransferase